MQRVLNVLSYVGMALVFGAVVIRFGRTPLGIPPEWDSYAVYAALTGLALVLLYTIGQWRDIVAYFRGRNARYGALTGVSVLVVLGILIAVNYVSAQQNRRWDLTENRQYSLSDQTVQLLQNLEEPVRFLVFDQETGFDRFRTRLTEYEYQSENVEVEYIDADRRPVQTKEYEIQQYGTVVVEYMGRRERVTSDQEQDLTNALIKVLNPVMHKVYFLAGHGEKDPEDTERDGYSAIADALRRDNYQFEKLVLAQTNEIPADATMIVIAGPQTDLLEQEVPLIGNYLNMRAGKLMVMLDPSDSLTQPRSLPRLEGLLKEWGIEATQSMVVDVSGLTRIATMPVGAPPYPNHPITDRFELITMFPTARAVTPFTAPQNRSATTFMQTTPRSWAETNLASLEDPEALAPETERGDIPGPVSIGVAIAVPAPDRPETPPEAQADATADAPEEQSPETRIVAFGDSDFVANNYLGVEGNGDLFLNAVNWLAQQENLIAVRPRQAADRRLAMTERGIWWMFALSIFIVPAAVLGAGVVSWWRRR